MRISDGENPLDNSAVHPESYGIVQHMAKDLGKNIEELIGDTTIRKQIDLTKYVTETVGMPTLNDILDELEKPGRDPRPPIKVFEFDPNVRDIRDLQEGWNCRASHEHNQFRSVLRHRHQGKRLDSYLQLGRSICENPSDVVSLHQHVKVCAECGFGKKRIQLKLIE